MSQLEDFKEKAKNDPSLRAELATLAGKSRGELVDGVSAVAAKHGYTLSESEIKTAMDRQIGTAGARDLNDAELDQIAAGECYEGYNPNTFGHL